MAQANLGGLLASQGELEQARKVLEAAIESGNPQAAPIAQANLGALLMSQGELEQARALLEQVVASGDPENAPPAADLLGDLLVEQEDIAGAQTRVSGGHRFGPSPVGLSRAGRISACCS